MTVTAATRKRTPHANPAPCGLPLASCETASRIGRDRLWQHDSWRRPFAGRNACQTLSAVTDPSMTGGCLCGGIRFELTEPARVAGYCHCTRCQRRTGTAASAQARIDGRTFRLLQGEELVKAWRHPDGGFEKCFCRECGAHLFSRNPEDPRQMSVRLGAFDGDPGVRPSWRTFVAYAASWEPIPDDGLERYDEGKPRL